MQAEHSTFTAFSFLTYNHQPYTSEEYHKTVTLDNGHPSLADFDLPLPAIEEFRIGISIDPRNLNQRLVIPIHNHNDTLVGYAGYASPEAQRRGEPRYQYLGAATRELLNVRSALQRIQRHPIHLVTDPITLLHLWRKLFPIVSFVGDTICDTQVLRLQHLFPGATIMLLTDETIEGKEQRSHLLERLSRYNPVLAPRLLSPGRQISSLLPDELEQLSNLL